MSGLNARAVDFDKFGLLYANGGAWRGRQLVRFGRDFGYPDWPELLSDLARRLNASTTGKAS